MRQEYYERKLLSRARALGSVIPIQITFEAPLEQQESGMSTKIKYDPYFSELLSKRLKHGDTVTDFCNKIGISRNKFYRWRKRYPAFNKAFKNGREAGKEIWQLRCKIPFQNPKSGKKFPNTSYHRLLAANIYGKDFLPPKRKLTESERAIAEIGRMALYMDFRMD
jgi:hypothetical protein